MRNTVIISTRNRLDMLKRAVDSVFKQTEPQEIIIADDGSSDEQVQYCIDLEKSSAEVFYLRGPDYPDDEKRTTWLSFCHLINVAQGYVKTPYVSYLCDDDLYFPDRCAKMADFLDNNPSIGCVFGRQIIEEKDVWGFRDLDHDKVAAELKKGITPRPKNPINHNVAMHRAEFQALWSTDPDDRQWIDFTAWRSLLDQGVRFQEIDLITGEYFVWDDNISEGWHRQYIGLAQ